MSIEPKKPFPVAESILIREAGEGFNETWLQDQICENPSILTLGDLEFFARERMQWKNGRLDIVLRDEEKKKMFEVEVMLGETDEKHIIHTIEYWDNEKRKFPLWQHYPVLVAESFDTRFFNIIHLFSQTIPLIAVKVSLVVANGEKCLHFAKIIDTYQEPEETEVPTYVPFGEEEWREDSPWTLENAKLLLEIVKPVFPNGKLHYTKARIVIVEDGRGYVWIHRRASNKSQITFWIKDKLLPSAVGVLDKAGIVYVERNQDVSFPMDSKSLNSQASTILEFATISKQSYLE